MGEMSPFPWDKGWTRAGIRQGVQDNEGRPTPR
jgi:hypothetical protein